MCFKLRYLVEHVAEPDVIEKFQLFRTKEGLGNGPSARDRVDAAIGLWLNNKLVTEVLKVAESLPRRKWVLGEKFPALPERGVLITTAVAKHHLPKDIAPKEVTFISHDVRMDNKVIVLQLNDFSYLQMVSVSYRETAQCYIEADVRLKFGLKADRGTLHTYKRP